jgi:hypothetical protein
MTGAFDHGDAKEVDGPSAKDWRGGARPPGYHSLFHGAPRRSAGYPTEEKLRHGFPDSDQDVSVVDLPVA